MSTDYSAAAWTQNIVESPIILCRMSMHPVTWMQATVEAKLPLPPPMVLRAIQGVLSGHLVKMRMAPMPCTVKGLHLRHRCERHHLLLTSKSTTDFQCTTDSLCSLSQACKCLQCHEPFVIRAFSSMDRCACHCAQDAFCLATMTLQSTTSCSNTRQVHCT